MKNIIFDFGGVLLEWNSDYFYAQYFNYNLQEMERFYQQTGIKEANKRIDRGESFDSVLKPILDKTPQYSEALSLWKKAWHKMIGNEITGSVDLLRALHAKGYNLYGLTNWSAETFPYVYYSYDFFHLFKDIVVSGREKLIKPEAEIYQLCLSRNEIKASESVFIDDNLDNIKACEALGIKGIHFKNAEQLGSDLRALGVSL
ncbi:HAD family hydrolase [Facilibium subflavum]|uniref:HAD family hydrolase n=1 Tax=Facilibium subflavum TaxID=2219058 RepID=UPI000E65264C|nr:HAD family phosphatase [Facilibium subflavum]